MRILLASSSSGSQGGGEIFLHYLGEALESAGHEVVLWCSDHPRMDNLAGRFENSIRADYRNTYDLKLRSLGAGLHSRNIESAISDWTSAAPDVVHINKQNLEDGLDLLKSAERCGIPHLTTIHITQSARYLKASNGWLRDLVSKRALRRYPGLLTAVSDQRRRELQSFVGSGRDVLRIYNGIPDVDADHVGAWRSETRKKLGIADGEKLFTTVARMTAQKNPQEFLDSAEQIANQDPCARFLWVGDGDFSDQWDRWVSDHGLGDKITRLGWQDDTRLFFAASDIYLHLAKYEGLPLAILEAMRFSLPCFIAPSIVDEVDAFADSALFRAEGDWIKKSIPAAHEARAATRQLYESQFRSDVMADHFVTAYQNCQ